MATPNEPQGEELDQLEDDIESVRKKMRDQKSVAEREQQFIDDGATPDEEVDNTITPPG